MKVKYIPRSKNSSGANVIVDNNGRIYSKGRAGYKTKGAAKRAAKELINPGGRKLTKQEFVKRYLNGIGYAKGFSKPELEQLVTRERNGTGIYARQLNKHVKPK